MGKKTDSTVMQYEPLAVLINILTDLIILFH